MCDESRLFADSLACLLEGSGYDVVGCLTDLGVLTSALRSEAVDGCVVGLTFGGRPDPEGIRAAVEAAPATRFLLLSELEDPIVMGHASCCGVHGVAFKTDDTDDIVAALVSTMAQTPLGRWQRREPLLSAAARRRMARPPRDEHRLARFLTPREREILVRLVQGETTAAAARSMGVRVSTARTHVDAVLTKLGVHTRGEAVAYAVREGLVDLAGVDLGLQAAAQ